MRDSHVSERVVGIRRAWRRNNALCGELEPYSSQTPHLLSTHSERYKRNSDNASDYANADKIKNHLVLIEMGFSRTQEITLNTCEPKTSHSRKNPSICLNALL